MKLCDVRMWNSLTNSRRTSNCHHLIDKSTLRSIVVVRQLVKFSAESSQCGRGEVNTILLRGYLRIFPLITDASGLLVAVSTFGSAL
jgi:hypothetical protein